MLLAKTTGMHAFRLKPDVKLKQQAGHGNCLRHKKTGHTMALSEEEAQFLASCGGQELVPEDILQKPAVDFTMVLGLLARIAEEGFFATKHGARPKHNRTKKHVDKVPRIRNELRFTPGEADGLVEVIDMQCGRSVTMYDCEANIARMLDGRRTVKEVVHLAQAIGIETSPDALRNFFQQLEVFGFVMKKPTQMPLPRGYKTWPPEMRKTYRTAQRHVRHGKFSEAIECLEVLLQANADIDEARAFIKQLQAQQKRTEAMHAEGRQGKNGAAASGIEAPPDTSPANPFKRFGHSALQEEDSEAAQASTRPFEAPHAAAALEVPWTVSKAIASPSFTLPQVSDSILAFDPYKPPDDKGKTEA